MAMTLVSSRPRGAFSCDSPAPRMIASLQGNSRLHHIFLVLTYGTVASCIRSTQCDVESTLKGLDSRWKRGLSKHCCIEARVEALCCLRVLPRSAWAIFQEARDRNQFVSLLLNSPVVSSGNTPTPSLVFRHECSEMLKRGCSEFPAA